MIPFLIYTLYQKMANKHLIRSCSHWTMYRSVFLVTIFVALLILFLSLIPAKSGAQRLLLNYTVKKSGVDIGWLTIERNIDGIKSIMTLNSEIQTRIIWLLKITARESSTFENGKLICSAQFRKANGTIKLDKTTRFAGTHYEVLENSGRENLAIPFIGTNLLSLYFEEPVGIAYVYCDKHQLFIPIQKMDDGGYKVKFPGGSSNCFYYRGGICNKIEISTSFYNVIILPDAKNN